MKDYRWPDRKELFLRLNFSSGKMVDRESFASRNRDCCGWGRDWAMIASIIRRLGNEDRAFIIFTHKLAVIHIVERINEGLKD